MAAVYARLEELLVVRACCGKEVLKEEIEEQQEILNAPRPPRGLNVLCYVIFLGTFEWGMVIPTLFPLLRRMDAPAAYFGLIIGTFSSTRMLCQPLVGALGDRFDFKVLLCSSLACSALGGMLYAVAFAPWFLLMSRIICGLGASCTPLLFAWTARVLGVDQVTGAQVRLNTMRSLGTFIGPFSSTALCLLPEEGLFNKLNSAGWAIALANILGLFLCVRCLDDAPIVKESKDVEQNKVKEASVWTNPVLWICLLFRAITALLLAVLEVVPPIVLTTEFQLPPSATSVLFGVASLLVLSLFALTGAISMSERSLMAIGIFAISLGAFWAQLRWNSGGALLDFLLPWTILAVAPAPFIRTPARALYTSHLPRSVQGTMQGISEAVFSLANFLGPIWGSHVAGQDGLDGLRLLILLLVLLEFSLLAIGFIRLLPGTELH